MFLAIPAALLFALIYYFDLNHPNKFWFILIFFSVLMVSSIIGDKFWRFCANNSFRKNKKGRK